MNESAAICGSIKIQYLAGLNARSDLTCESNDSAFSEIAPFCLARASAFPMRPGTVLALTIPQNLQGKHMIYTRGQAPNSSSS